MFTFLLSIFILVSLVLIIVVLMQSSKGGGLAGAFGGAGSDSSVLGGRGAASLLSKITIYLAAGYMVLALMLAIASSRSPVESSGPVEDGVVAGARDAGALNTYDVDANTNILDEISTEGAVAPEEETGEETPPPSED
ncbi:MAG: preprotein translocase subunit SecG [bacterium]|nr:preprotein translocase subunit SecG [bacterium]